MKKDLGTFDTREEAGRARDKRVAELHPQSISFINFNYNIILQQYPFSFSNERKNTGEKRTTCLSLRNDL